MPCPLQITIDVPDDLANRLSTMQDKALLKLQAA
jgi:hypothetical protein